MVCITARAKAAGTNWTGELWLVGQELVRDTPTYAAFERRATEVFCAVPIGTP
jgi:hypothetical protein